MITLRGSIGGGVTTTTTTTIELRPLPDSSSPSPSSPKTAGNEMKEEGGGRVLLFKSEAVIPTLTKNTNFYASHTGKYSGTGTNDVESAEKVSLKVKNVSFFTASVAASSSC